MLVLPASVVVLLMPPFRLHAGSHPRSWRRQAKNLGNRFLLQSFRRLGGRIDGSKREIIICGGFGDYRAEFGVVF